jgi:tritrans,polycis-undecaprenyl-diphosphate synthase [geranylgeranyl-diphosphate specific]
MNNIPKSIAIIPDGNRRCARRLMVQPWKGHEWGAEKVKEVFGWCKELDIKNLTIYALSLENINSRPKIELNHLFNIARREFRDVNINPKHFVHRDKVRLYFFGDISKLPKDLQEEMRKAAEKTKKYSDYRINYAVAYGGRQEILTACKRLAAECADPSSITENMFKHSLQTNGMVVEPDLILRTGGEKRLSNFLLFQSAYSELSFIEPFWPDLKKEDFVAVIKDYSNRKRRFGK